MQEFAGVDLEDSFILGWNYDAAVQRVTFELEASLWPGHPFHEPPARWENACYRRALLVFDDIRNIRGLRPVGEAKGTTDPDGRTTYGKIEGFQQENETVRFRGEMGDVEIEGSSIRLLIHESVVILPFHGGGSCPVQYEIDLDGHHYYVRYRHSWLTIELDDKEIVWQQLAPESTDDGEWSDEETNAYLYLISEALRSGKVESLLLPSKTVVCCHPFYRSGPLPRYSLCICNRRHKHTSDCYSGETFSALELGEWTRAIENAIHSWPSIAEVAGFALARKGFGNPDGGRGIVYPDPMEEYGPEYRGVIYPGFIVVYGGRRLAGGYEFEVPESLYRKVLVRLLAGAGLASLVNDIENALEE